MVTSRCLLRTYWGTGTCLCCITSGTWLSSMSSAPALPQRPQQILPGDSHCRGWEGFAAELSCIENSILMHAGQQEGHSCL